MSTGGAAVASHGPAPLELPLRLRGDLVFSPEADGGAVVKDPLNDRFFHLRELEAYVAHRLDGVADLEAIRRDAEEHFGGRLRPEVIEAFVERLGVLGLMDWPLPAARPDRRRWKGGVFYLRLPLLDPDRILDRLTARTKWLFTPASAGFSIFALSVALAVAAANANELASEMIRLVSLEGLIAVWLTLLVVTAAHEFAHGVACKHYGGQVHEMGFMLIFFQPALYCNVSDAWLFPEKSKRLWVSFAGAYLELFFWALAVVMWRATEPGSAPHTAALVVAATSGLKTLMNMNPLIRLDGYYLLSDALEIPNLRQRSWRHFKQTILRTRSKTAERATTPRERRIYLAYGAASTAFIAFVLTSVLVGFGGLLIEKFQAFGFLLTVAIAAALIRNPFKSDGPRSPTGPEDSAASSWRNRRARWALIGLVVFAAAWLPLELKVAGEFRILPSTKAEARAEVEGIITEVLRREGDSVQRGDLIARLSSREEQARLEEIDAQIAEKQARLRLLEVGPRFEEIEVARKSLATAETRVEQAMRRRQEAQEMLDETRGKARISIDKGEELILYARKYFDMNSSLYAEGLVSEREVEQAREDLTVRTKELQELRAELQIALANDLAEQSAAVAVAGREREEAAGELNRLLAGSRPEEIEATQAELDRLDAQRRGLQERLQLAEIRSPAAGILTTPKIEEKVGQFAAKGDLISEVHDLNVVRAEIAVPENEIGDVAIGDPVAVKARAFPGKSFSGEVASIAAAAMIDESRGNARFILVTTVIDNAEGLLKPEMTGAAKISCGKRRLADLVTRRLVRYLRVEFWAWW